MIVALDVGGTSVKSGVVSEGRVVGEVHRRTLDASAPADVLVADLAATANDLLAWAVGVTALAIAFPAPFDYAAGVPRLEHKFAELNGLDLGAALAGRLATAGPPPIRFVNDAEAAVVGEAVHGAGRAARRVLGVTLGTGLGAALVDRGVPVREVAGLVVGDLYRVDVGGRSADDRYSARGLAAKLGLEPPADLVAAADAARAGGERELEAFARLGTELGRFLGGLVGTLRVEVVVVGGGLSGAFDLFGTEMQRSARVPVLAGVLGPAAALVGAAHLVSAGTGNR